MRFPARAIVVLVASATTSGVSAFAPQPMAPYNIKTTGSSLRSLSVSSANKLQSLTTTLFSTTESDEQASSSSSSADVDLTDEEWTIVKDLVKRAADDTAALQEQVAQTLPTMQPSFIMKLRNVEQQQQQVDDDDTTAQAQLVSVATALRSVLDSRLAGGREVLAELLNAGEIRKLDAAIGKFARQGQLDMAFFTVLNMNMQNAVESSTDNEDASRSQILQHIYTRCQEEVEKTIPGGVALLNKVLRTEIGSIRANQLEHYLCPQSNVVTSPDGKEIQLEGTKPVLVPPSEFMDAIAAAVKQIRTVEKAGGTDRESAAGLVESCRNVASEARLAIAKNYGVDSKELREFEDGLMPVFRPESPDSPYIQGQ